MKKILIITGVVLLLALGIGAWVFLGPATGFSDSRQALYIPSNGATKEGVLDSLQKHKIINNTGAFNLLAGRLNYWTNIRPGKYEIEKGASLLSMVRKLRNGQQTPVNLVITKWRTKSDFARSAGARFEFDSAAMSQFLNNADSLSSYNVSPETAMTLVLPDTYTYLWNTTPEKVYQKLAAESKKFWTPERLQKGLAKGLTPVEASIVASIVEEETNATKEKGTIASVYLNRLKKGMPLQADPTVKFALNDFALKRIYHKHLSFPSPYNTYLNKGLPPGPICTPSKKTIDAVLNAPETDFIYFVASPRFDGTHDFSATYAEHLQKAKAYQQALNEQETIRKNKG